MGLERAGMETVAFCEIEDYPRKVLNKHWPDIPIASDVTKLTYQDGALFDDGKEICRGTVGILVGGFPCQPFSHAGRRKGTGDDRHLWPEMLRLISETKPSWVIGENVAGLISMELGRMPPRVESSAHSRFDDLDILNQVFTRQEIMLLGAICDDLEEVGYEVQPITVPACAINAKHRRDRIWILCHAKHDGRDAAKIRESLEKRNGGDEARQEQASELAGPGDTNDVADTISSRQQGQGEYLNASDQAANREGQAGHAINERGRRQRGIEPRLGGATHGLSGWVHRDMNPDNYGVPRVTTESKNRAARLKCLGNAVVPQIPELIGRAIMEVENDL